MEDPQSLKDVKNIQLNLLNGMITEYIDEFETIFGPFCFDSIKPLMIELIGRVKAFVDVQKPEIHKFLEFETNQRYEICDETVFEHDYVEKTFNIDHNDPNKKRTENFLIKQRMLALLDESELDGMNNIDYSISEMEPDAIYNISLMKKNSELNMIYIFSDKWIRAYDETMEQKEIVENKFGDIRDVDFLGEYCAIGCYSGDLFITKGVNLEIVYKYNISL